MPEAWTKKRERQYQHIKESAKQRGLPEDRAEEIAARTVNKNRREEGETDSLRTEGTGNPNLNLEQRKKDEIYNIAKEYDIAGRSKMTKKELIAALRDRR
jgi:hypothetical protein